MAVRPPGRPSRCVWLPPFNSPTALARHTWHNIRGLLGGSSGGSTNKNVPDSCFVFIFQ